MPDISEALAHAHSLPPQEALGYLDAARKQHGDTPPLLFAMGNIFRKLNMNEAALQLYRQVITALPEDAAARNNAAACLLAMHRYDDARHEIQAALKAHASHAALWVTLGTIDFAEGKLENAEKTLRHALALTPDSVEALANLAEVLTDQENFAEAILLQEKALALSSDPLVGFNLSHNLFKTGDLARAWALYEKRHARDDGAKRAARYTAPRWNGEKTSATVLVWMEQGVGEEILYSGLLPEAAARCGKLLVECDARLLPLFMRSFSGMVFIARSETPADALAEATLQIPAASLGGIFRNKMADFPANPPVLKADAVRAQQLKARYAQPGKKIIGISWRGKPRHFGDFKTSELAQWQPILSQPGYVFLDLQYGDTEKERAEMAARGFPLLHDPEIDPLKSLDDFAAQVAACDRVITISNTTAHMAGALRVPCDVLAPAGKDAPHHWFHRQENSPWYPGLRLHWQKTRGVWKDILEKIATDLAVK